MFIVINKLVRCRPRLLVLVAAATLALMLLATHSAATTGHHDMHGADDDGAQVVMTICLAILQAGLAIAFVAGVINRRRENTLVPAPITPLLAYAGPIAGVGPPGRRSALFQVFLR